MRNLKELPQAEVVTKIHSGVVLRGKRPPMKLPPTEQLPADESLIRKVDQLSESECVLIPESRLPVPEFVDGIACESTFVRIGKKLLALRRHRELGFRKLDAEAAVQMYNQHPKRFVELQYQVCIYRYESHCGEVFDTDFHIDFNSATASLKAYFESLEAENKLRKTKVILSFSDGMSHVVEFIAGGKYDTYEHNAHVMILTSIIEGRSWAKLQSERQHFENIAWRMKLLNIDNWVKPKAG